MTEMGELVRPLLLDRRSAAKAGYARSRRYKALALPDEVQSSHASFTTLGARKPDPLWTWAGSVWSLAAE
jgi:hypothetical protein